MVRQAFIIAALAASAAADDVVSVFLPAFDPQPLVGSQIGSSDGATTYIIACASGTPDDQCGIDSAHEPTVIAGSKTNELHYAGETLTIHSSCAIDADIATCTETVVLNNVTQSDVGTITGVSASMLAVTVTATGSAPASTSSGGGETVSSTTTNAPATTESQGTNGDDEDETKDNGGDDDKADNTKEGDKKDGDKDAAAGISGKHALFAAAAVMGGMLML